MQPAEKITCTTDTQPIEQFTVICTPEDVFNWTEFWTTLAAVSSALFTLAAVIVAIRAWRSAESNLQLVRRQIAEQRKSAKDAIEAQQRASQDAIKAQQESATAAIETQQALSQAALSAQREDMSRSLEAQEKAAESSIEAQRILAVEGRQIEYLAAYSAAILNLGNALYDEGADLPALRRETTRTWMIWSMQLFNGHTEFRQLTSRWNSYVERNVDSLHGQWLAARSNPDRLPAIEELVEALVTNIGAIIGNLQLWQTDLSRRPEAEAKFRDIDVVEAAEAATNGKA